MISSLHTSIVFQRVPCLIFAENNMCDRWYRLWGMYKVDSIQFHSSVRFKLESFYPEIIGNVQLWVDISNEYKQGARSRVVTTEPNVAQSCMSIHTALVRGMAFYSRRFKVINKRSCSLASKCWHKQSSEEEQHTYDPSTYPTITARTNEIEKRVSLRLLKSICTSGTMRVIACILIIIFRAHLTKREKHEF